MKLLFLLFINKSKIQFETDEGGSRTPFKLISNVSKANHNKCSLITLAISISQRYLLFTP